MPSPRFMQLAEDAKKRVREVSASEAVEAQAQGAVLIDVREGDAVVDAIEQSVAIGVDRRIAIDRSIDVGVGPQHRVVTEAGVATDAVDADLIARARGRARNAGRHSRRVARREADEERTGEPHASRGYRDGAAVMASYVLQ